jgi:hypothetical protein
MPLSAAFDRLTFGGVVDRFRIQPQGHGISRLFDVIQKKDFQ